MSSLLLHVGSPSNYFEVLDYDMDGSISEEEFYA